MCVKPDNVSLCCWDYWENGIHITLHSMSYNWTADINRNKKKMETNLDETGGLNEHVPQSLTQIFESLRSGAI